MATQRKRSWAAGAPCGAATPTANHQVVSGGPGNDQNAVLLRVLSAPGNTQASNNYIVPGYAVTDLNLDGKTIGAGPGSDLNGLLTTILSYPSNTAASTNYIVKEQVPLGILVKPTLAALALPADVPNLATYIIQDSDYTTPLDAAQKASLMQRGEPVPATTTLLNPPTTTVSSAQPSALAGAQAATAHADQPGWVSLYSENFDGGFPTVGQHGACKLTLGSNNPTNDPNNYRWGGNNFRTDANSPGAAWSAAVGNLGKLLQPGTNTYPDSTTTQIICTFSGLNLTHLKNIRVEFALWLDAADANDLFFVGFKAGGTIFSGKAWQNTPLDSNGTPTWQRYSFFYPDLAAQVQANNGNLAIVWEFRSDSHRRPAARGAWLDSINVERYVEPDTSVNCIQYANDPATQLHVPGAPGSGTVSKGLALPPETEDNTWANGLDPALITRLQTANTNWVRLEFITQPSAYLHLLDATSIPASIDLKHYDQLIDALCASHIPILGLIDYQTVADKSWQIKDSDGIITDQYLKTFTQTTAMLAGYYGDRIKAWEVWNEPDATESKLSPAAYAKLLVGVSPVIRSKGAQVVFGGLVSADDNSSNYLSDFYTALRINHNSVATPFDIFGIHPYPSTQYTDATGKRLLDPDLYLHKGAPTIFDKFHTVLKGLNNLSRNDSNKDIWVTEIGWNSAVGSDASLKHTCMAAEELWVTPDQQTAYLPASFNILFKETAWPSENRASVTKIFWYQYRDTSLNLNKSTQCLNWPAKGSISWYLTDWYRYLFGPSTTDSVTVPWSYGLYNGDFQPKFGVFCTFKTYPNAPDDCYNFNHRVYLPIIQGQSVTAAGAQ